jgi:Bacterial membrane protein YfhO
VLKTSSGRDGKLSNVNAWDGWSGLYFETQARAALTEVYRDSDVFIYRNENALPRARFVPAAVKAPPGFVPGDLKSSTVDLASAVFLDGYHDESTWATDTMSTPVVEYREDNARQVRLHVSAPCRGFVVLADLYYPGWKASVDGTPLPIYRANYAFRAVEVKPGDHDIVFSYSPWTIRLGIPLMLLAIVSALVFFARRHLAMGLRRVESFCRKLSIIQSDPT